ncbi:hypothetical protein T484DRAFT_1803271 [Baffinella frigidus]|nr:hypothetical protein T484DRAFT_1803271 [Cryptophyta sp. CCMP2293]
MTMDPDGRWRLVADPDGKWRLVAVRARPSLVEGFVDGLHSQPAPMTLAG